MKAQLIKLFLNAVNTWKAYVIALRSANKRNDNRSKSALGRAVFYWRKQAEALKLRVDLMIKGA